MSDIGRRPIAVLALTPVIPLLAARSNDDDSGKFIGGVIFAIIWLVVAVIGKFSKKQQQEQRQQQQQYEPMRTQSVPPPMPPAPQYPHQQHPQQPQRAPTMEEALRMRREQVERYRMEQARMRQLQAERQKQAAMQQKRQQQQPQAKRRAPQPPAMPRPVAAQPLPKQAMAPAASLAPTSGKPDISASEIRSVPTKGQKRGLPSATAPLISRWMQPATLRSQFILTEILQPPLSLRPPRD